jgi:hypothetical protein
MTTTIRNLFHIAAQEPTTAPPLRLPRPADPYAAANRRPECRCVPGGRDGGKCRKCSEGTHQANGGEM